MMVTVQETVGRRVRFVKPAKFDYLRAENIDQVVEALDQGDGEAVSFIPFELKPGRRRSAT
jgi:hypothetical protein